MQSPVHKLIEETATKLIAVADDESRYLCPGVYSIGAPAVARHFVRIRRKVTREQLEQLREMGLVK